VSLSHPPLPPQKGFDDPSGRNVHLRSLGDLPAAGSSRSSIVPRLATRRLSGVVSPRARDLSTNVVVPSTSSTDVWLLGRVGAALESVALLFAVGTGNARPVARLGALLSHVADLITVVALENALVGAVRLAVTRLLAVEADTIAASAASSASSTRVGAVCLAMSDLTTVEACPVGASSTAALSLGALELAVSWFSTVVAVTTTGTSFGWVGALSLAMSILAAIEATRAVLLTKIRRYVSELHVQREEL
jgi:hypothetical protein